MIARTSTHVSPAEHDALLARFAIHSHTEILFWLRAIQQRKLLVNLDLPDSQHVVITSVRALSRINAWLASSTASTEVMTTCRLSDKSRLTSNFRCWIARSQKRISVRE